MSSIINNRLFKIIRGVSSDVLIRDRIDRAACSIQQAVRRWLSRRLGPGYPFFSFKEEDRWRDDWPWDDWNFEPPAPSSYEELLSWSDSDLVNYQRYYGIPVPAGSEFRDGWILSVTNHAFCETDNW